MARRVPTERQVTGRVATATTLVLALAYPFASGAAEVMEAGPAESANTATHAAHGARPVPRIDSSAGLATNPYAGITNEQLADVADRWDALNQDERRWFFVEVRKRLIAGDGARALPLGASARFGQVVRGQDGRVLDVETTRVTERTVDAGEDPRAYGLGFERRLEVQGGSARSRAAAGPTPASVRLPIRVDQRPAKPDGGS